MPSLLLWANLCPYPLGEQLFRELDDPSSNLDCFSSPQNQHEREPSDVTWPQTPEPETPKPFCLEFMDCEGNHNKTGLKSV